MLHGRADSVLGAVQDAEDVGDNVMLDLADLHVPPDDVYEVWDGRGHLLGRSPNWQGSAGMRAPDHNGFFRHQASQSADYRLLFMRGTRIVDPGEPGGGKLRFVTILYGAPTERVWERDLRRSRILRGRHASARSDYRPADCMGAPSRTRAAAPAGLDGRPRLGRFMGVLTARLRARNRRAGAAHASALENALQRLERSFNQQRAFVSDAAHELKTAVAVVKSSLQLVGMRQRTPEEYQAGNERALADTERIEELVAKMLTLARVENTAAAAVAGACDLNQCIATTISELETFAAVRQVNSPCIFFPAIRAPSRSACRTAPWSSQTS